MMASIHNAQLIKADTRLPEPLSAGRAYTTVAGEGVVVRDTFVSAASAVWLGSERDVRHFIIPIVGTFTITALDGAQQQLAPGEIYSYDGSHNRRVRVRNDFANESINLFHIMIPLAAKTSELQSPSVDVLDITSKNHLIMAGGFAKCIKAGVYDGRAEDVISLSPTHKHLVYIVNGSFEVEGRLMEHRDGLLVWDIDQIEFEALSEAAIILMIEYSPSK